jgi:hypothetical protein
MAEICPEAYLLVDETYREAAYADDPIAKSALALGAGRFPSPRSPNVTAHLASG